jgi:nickel/cobalt exporter
VRLRRSVRRAGAVAALTVAMTAALGALAAAPASAHPLGNFTINRFAGLYLYPGRIQVLYALDMAEIPTYQATPSIDSNHDGRVAPSERASWATRTSRRLLAGTALTADGTPVRLAVSCSSMTFRSGQAGAPILRLEAWFVGSLPSSGRLSFADSNYSDRVGWKEIDASAGSGVDIVRSTVPARSASDELLRYPVDLLANPLHVSSASVDYRAAPAPAPAPATVPAPSCGRRVPVASQNAFARLVTWRLTPLVLMSSILLAFAFGAVHALGPGHGKTITAAYLVGAGARKRQAVLVGGAVSLMHTASVLALGLVAFVLSRTFPAERVYPWLGVATGAVALGLGGALLVGRVRARRRGIDPWHGHSHGHPQEHAHQEAERAAGTLSGRGLLALAVAGGILPSPTALVVLTGAIVAHRVAYGLSLIAAFSAGLATALMVVGLLALRARSAVSRRMEGRLGGLLPIASAAVIVGFGLFFVVRGAVQIAAV